MPSAIWTGAISFGLVQVPVRLVDGDPQQGRELQPARGGHRRAHPVPQGLGRDRRRGPGRPDRARLRDLEGPVRHRRATTRSRRCGPKGSHAIEIEEFVDLDEIDPLYFEQPYYLVPDERGVKPYELLVEAMTELNKVAIGRIVMRSKERLVAIRPLDGMLCVETMRYADEVVPRDESGARRSGDVELTERERHDGAPARRVARVRRVRRPRSTTTSTASSCSTSSSARPRARRSSPSRRPRRRRRCSTSWPRSKRRSRRRRPPRTATRARAARKVDVEDDDEDEEEDDAREAAQGGRQEGTGEEDRGQEGPGQEAHRLARARQFHRVLLVEPPAGFAYRLTVGHERVAGLPPDLDQFQDSLHAETIAPG